MTEPELVGVWRRIIARRDELKDEIERWSRPDHPIAQYVARVAQASGGEHGYTDRRLAELEQQARDNAARARDELRRFDEAIRRGTRDDPGSEGHTLEQLYALAEHERRVLESRARAAIVQWLDGGSPFAKDAGEQLLRMLLVLAGTPPNMPPADLERLRSEDKRPASSGARPSFARERVARRIVARFKPKQRR